MLKSEPLTVVIPARRGSKGIPGKNLYRLGRDTLLERSIKLAARSTYVDRTIVTTDDPEMLELLPDRVAHLPSPRRPVLRLQLGESRPHADVCTLPFEHLDQAGIGVVAIDGEAPARDTAGLSGEVCRNFGFGIEDSGSEAPLQILKRGHRCYGAGP